MPNHNCLEGIQCPRCGQEDRFRITAIITCDVTDAGSDPVGDHYWDDSSFTSCSQCTFEGTLKQFQS